MTPRIMVVDDEVRYQRLLQINLASEGYVVITAANGYDALELIAHSDPDLVLLDILMPKMDGFVVCERVRQFSDVPIIMLTARGAEEDKVRCLNLGADDYITKPFSATEVLARVRAVLRRTLLQKKESQDTVFENGNLKIDYGKAEVWKDSQVISLTATEYKLLIMFTHNTGKVITADELLSSTWGTSI